MLNKIVLVALLCSTELANAMERNLLFTDPTGAQAALPSGLWNTPEKKALVIAICHRILTLAPTTGTLEISQYCNLILTWQYRMNEERSASEAHEMFEMRQQLLALWRRFVLPAAHNNANSHKRQRL